MFAFCDIELQNGAVIRGVLLHHNFNEGVHIFTRQPEKLEHIEVNKYVAYIPLTDVHNIEYFSYVNLYERVSAVPLLTDEQKELFRIELKRHLLHKGFDGIETIMDRMTIEECMILLTEVEAGKYELVDGSLKKHLSEGDVYDIDFNNVKTVTWLLASYMDIATEMKKNLDAGEIDLKEYREVFYNKSIEEIARNNQQR